MHALGRLGRGRAHGLTVSAQGLCCCSWSERAFAMRTHREWSDVDGDPTDARHEAGMQARRRVLGDAHVDRAQAAATPLDAGFQRWITETVWGSVWTRDGLTDRERSLVTIAILAALGRDELDLHLKATANTGASPEDVAEVMLHVGAYAGVPAANHGMARAKEILGGGDG